ncbi:antirestriction protein ArdA [Kordiimonas pumila]|uniref:Antirestriction protein ArdA n=1 Tax=Kordiimonas pumila TaxID=2161677 RepID=A0ABV7D529_9PROT|nr:antirestriction protein ArdA [Kordiimonas pumila]
MTFTFHATPFDISAAGFYFSSADEYRKKSANHLNEYYEIVEEFEIQPIDGETLDLELFKALSINQSNICTFIEKCEEWEDHEKYNIIIAAGECGYDFDIDTDSPYDFDIDIYDVDNLKDLAYQFVDEGLFGDIPMNIACYLDYDAIARDLGVDYTETVINGQSIVYRCS